MLPQVALAQIPAASELQPRISEHIVNDFTTPVSGGLIATDFYLFSELQSLRFQRARTDN